jgi:hypothetical protein
LITLCFFLKVSYLSGCKGNAYGFRLEATGNAPTQSGGRIIGTIFFACQAERIGIGTSGVGIGGTASGSSSGAGVQGTELHDFIAGNFTVNVDYAHQGSLYYSHDLSDSGAATAFSIDGGFNLNGTLRTISATGNTAQVVAADTASDTSLNVNTTASGGSLSATNVAQNSVKPLTLNPFGGSVTLAVQPLQLPTSWKSMAVDWVSAVRPQPGREEPNLV